MTRRLSDTERKLWSRVTRGVRRTSPRRPDEEAASDSDEPAAPAKAPAASLSPRAPARRAPGPLEDISGQRRVRRGQAQIDARLDLHGLTYDAARGELVRFLLREHRGGARCVLVITGKGKAGRGVLRTAFLDWIGDPDVRPIVAGYARAHLRHGGEGAFYVMLKARRGE